MSDRVDWLTRRQIDEVIDNLSAADLIEHMPEAQDAKSSARFAGQVFDKAAARLGLSNGTAATESIRLADFRYMAQKLGEAVNLNAPLSEEPEGSPASAATGE